MYQYPLEEGVKVELPTSTSQIISAWPSDKSVNVSTSPVIIVYASQPIFRSQLPSKFSMYLILLSKNLTIEIFEKLIDQWTRRLNGKSFKLNLKC